MDFRMTIWESTLSLLPARWVLGYGPETYLTAYSLRYQGDAIPGEHGAYDPHNLLLYQLTAVGCAGLLAFLWALIRFYRVTCASFLADTDWHSGASTAAVLGSATAYLIQAQFNPDSIVLLTVFWLVLVLGVVGSRLPRPTTKTD